MKPTQQLVLDGIAALQAKHKEGEAHKVGILRAGNTGALIGSAFVGKCPRLTYLRALGIDGDVEDTGREFMFAAGRTNEDSWLEKLLAAGLPPSRIKRESEWPIEWILPSGRKVTGRPDFVLLDEEGRAARGLELKLVSSLWTGRDVLLKERPKMDHLLQATHYMWKVGTPFEIWYTSRALYQIPYMKNVPWPKRGTALSKYFAYGEDDEVRNMVPFYVGFELRFNHAGQVEYRALLHGKKEWVTTDVTVASIEAYYREVDSLLGEREELPARPSSLQVDGSKKSGRACDYCVFAQVCDKREKAGKTEWVESAKKWLTLLPMSGSVQT